MFKKLFGILGSAGLVATASTAVVSCSDNYIGPNGSLLSNKLGDALSQMHLSFKEGMSKGIHHTEGLLGHGIATMDHSGVYLFAMSFKALSVLDFPKWTIVDPNKDENEQYAFHVELDDAFDFIIGNNVATGTQRIHVQNIITHDDMKYNRPVTFIELQQPNSNEWKPLWTVQIDKTGFINSYVDNFDDYVRINPHFMYEVDYYDNHANHIKYLSIGWNEINIKKYLKQQD